jgi:Dyp-type peroxidase family
MTTENKEIDLKKIVEIVTPFDEFEYEPLLNEIQGNIIKSHGRNHAVYLFLKFNDNIEAAKQWIGSFSHRYVTSALEQAEQAKLFRQNKDVPGTIFANFFLTRAGYMHLGYTYEQLPSEDSFRQGMQDPNMQNELGDDSQQWEPGFQNEIHALVLLAADKIVGPRTKEAKLQEQKDQTKLRQQPVLLAQKVEKIKQEVAAIASVVQEQIGYVLRDATSGEEIEHFGFRDGVSQPLFLKRDIDKERGETAEDNDFSKWDPRAPLNLVLFKDPLGKEKESYGSFLVFRKLEQNVKGWNNDVVENLATNLKVAPELAGAYTMGRFQDGTVVVQSSQEDNNYKGNNFNYSEDPQGSKCPFFAHARKVNPRGDTGNPSLVSTPTLLEEEKMHRIARRAINYGPLPSEVPEKDAGLLFMCFQASLANQFNFMQKAWAKEQNFVKRDVGTDVVIGVEKRDDGGEAMEETYNWPTQWGAAGKTEATFDHWVTMKGGEFFFAPSMSFLKCLAPEPSRNIVFRGVPKQEIQAAQNIIAELRNYKQRNWAIGLNGDTTQPDGFLTFFNQRKLPFEFYLLNRVGLGNSGAYDNNIARLNKYIEDVITQEIDACEYKIAELKEYQRLNWAIGLNGDDPTKTDGFVNFFGERELPFEFYVRSQNVSLGDGSAYDKNITTLENYIKEL